MARQAPTLGRRVAARSPRRSPSMGSQPCCGRDRRPQADTAMHRGHQLLRIDELRLELDDEQASGLRMPGQDVDHAALAVVARRSPQAATSSPAAQPGLRATDSCMVGVRGVQDAVEFRALPPQRGPRRSRPAPSRPHAACPTSSDRHVRAPVGRRAGGSPEPYGRRPPGAARARTREVTRRVVQRAVCRPRCIAFASTHARHRAAALPTAPLAAARRLRCLRRRPV